MWLDAFARLKIKQRLYVQFALAVTPLVCLVGFQLLSVSDLPDRVNHELAAYRTSNEAITSYREFLNGVTDAVDTGKVSQHALKALQDARQDAQQVQQQAPSQQLQAMVATMQKIAEALAAHNDMQSLVALRQDIFGVDQGLKKLAAERERHLSGLVTDDDQATRARNKVVAAILVVTLVMLVLMLRQMVNRIIVPVSFAVSTAKRVAAGDLSQVLAPGKRDDGIGELHGALREMNDSLVAIVTRVREASELISVASDRMAAGNAELATRTTEQASSLESTAASMDELTLAVQRNSGNAQRANQLVQSASEVAVKGGEVVGQVVERMSAISNSSRNIVDIIAIINELAFQTNILALNAAVEAARAGEQGRGFAVVASEVRRLAQRSAEAAQEIKGLIDHSVQQIESGSELVTVAGRTMEQIVSSVRDVTDIMGEIASTSRQQSSGIEQVNHAVSALNGVTRKNAELVEEARLTADAMREQASRLVEAVGMFSVERGALHKPA